MRKHKLKREYRALPTSLDGVKLTVAKAIPMGGGERLLPGTDVTNEARGWRNLRMLLLRGYLVADPPVNSPRVVPIQDAAPAKPAPSPEKNRGNDPLSLSDVSESSSKRDIRKALDAAGVSVPTTFSKSDLLLEVNRLLAEAGE